MSVVPGRDGVLVACQAKRFRLACAIVGAAAAALVACSAFEASARSNGPGEAAAAVAEAGFDAVVSGGERTAFALPAHEPALFEDELFDVSSMSGAYWSSNAQLVSWCEKGSVEETLAALEGRLVAKGWVGVFSDSSSCRSFVKSEGAYRWAFASAAQVGEETSVVLQWSGTKDGGE